MRRLIETFRRQLQQLWLRGDIGQNKPNLQIDGGYAQSDANIKITGGYAQSGAIISMAASDSQSGPNFLITGGSNQSGQVIKFTQASGQTGNFLEIYSSAGSLLSSLSVSGVLTNNALGGTGIVTNDITCHNVSPNGSIFNFAGTVQIQGGVGNTNYVSDPVKINPQPSNTSGNLNMLNISPTYNQASGSGSNTDLLINRTETAVMSGTQLLADFQKASSSKWKCGTNGGTVQAAPAQMASFAVASLPTTGIGVGNGSIAYASNGRKSGEGAGAGTGIPVWFDGTNWKTFYDNTTAAA